MNCAPTWKLTSKRGYDPVKRAYLLFDNVNHVDFVLNYRALFQAKNNIHTLGDSRTGAYSYDVWLWRVPIVVTVDLSAAWDPAEAWIQANSVDVYLDRGCWVDRV